MATQVSEEDIELARDSLDGMSERSSQSVGESTRSSRMGTAGVPSAADRFAAVGWEEPPEEEHESDAEPEMRDAPSEPEGVPTAEQKFRTIHWDEPPAESTEASVPAEAKQWNDEMKLKNFFDDAGWE